MVFPFVFQWRHSLSLFPPVDLCPDTFRQLVRLTVPVF